MAKKNKSSLGKSNDDFIEFDYTDKHKAKNKYVSKRKAKKILKKEANKNSWKKAAKDAYENFNPGPAPPDFKSLPNDNPWQGVVDDPTTQNVGNPSGTGPGAMRLTPGVDTGMSPFPGKPSVGTILNNPTNSSIRPKFQTDPEHDDYDLGDFENSK
jgi:hypothetical protein